MQHFLNDLVFLFAVIDPIGTVPVFIAVTAGMSAKARRLIAIRAAAISAGLLLVTIVLGQLVLEWLEVDFAAIRVAGGVILFLFALEMIFGESKPEHEVAEVQKHTKDNLDVAVYPLGVLSIAGPGSVMAAILRTDNSQFTIVQQAFTAVAIGIILLITLGAMLLASKIQRVIGDVGASIISRVMGLLFAAIAADGVLTGVKQFFA
ncbi:MAG: UPF0056 inner membrane protein [Phycisphaeraceae bacterium]|nr:MAG: UPF0056 inner membrane protein [Phycisphaeraceae bacterium]